MCVNDVRWVYFGATCGARDLLYKKERDANGGNENLVRTDFNDYPGFPMVQQSVFNGKRFCGRKIKEVRG